MHHVAELKLVGLFIFIDIICKPLSSWYDIILLEVAGLYEELHFINGVHMLLLIVSWLCIRNHNMNELTFQHEFKLLGAYKVMLGLDIIHHR